MTKEISNAFRKLSQTKTKSEEEAAWRNLFRQYGMELNDEDIKTLTGKD